MIFRPKPHTGHKIITISIFAMLAILLILSFFGMNNLPLFRTLIIVFSIGVIIFGISLIISYKTQKNELIEIDEGYFIIHRKKGDKISLKDIVSISITEKQTTGVGVYGAPIIQKYFELLFKLKDGQTKTIILKSWDKSLINNLSNVLKNKISNLEIKKSFS